MGAQQYVALPVPVQYIPQQRHRNTNCARKRNKACTIYNKILCNRVPKKQNIESLFKDHIGKFEDLVLISTKIEHYLVEFLLIFFILKMRFKNLLLCCKFLKSVLKTGETETKTIYN